MRRAGMEGARAAASPSNLRGALAGCTQVAAGSGVGPASWLGRAGGRRRPRPQLHCRQLCGPFPLPLFLSRNLAVRLCPSLSGMPGRGGRGRPEIGGCVVGAEISPSFGIGRGGRRKVCLIVNRAWTRRQLDHLFQVSKCNQESHAIVPCHN
eukprot:2595536-Rhodomonas_salina.1